jgi:dTDP-4-dehydrorhamnose reductase
VVGDQAGTPTYAADLAEAIMKIIVTLDNAAPGAHAGIYHFSNEGNITWYDFAVAIKELSGRDCQVHAITTAQYPTPAKRPSYSVLDKTRIRQTFHIPAKDWRASLAVCIKRLLQE